MSTPVTRVPSYQRRMGVFWWVHKRSYFVFVMRELSSLFVAWFVVYLLMFIAAVGLRRRQPDVERGYRAPVLTFLCVVGFLASAAAIVIGFVPPSQFESGNAVAYGGLILAGTVLIGLLPPWLFLRFRKPSWKSAEAEATS